MYILERRIKNPLERRIKNPGPSVSLARLRCMGQGGNLLSQTARVWRLRCPSDKLRTDCRAQPASHSLWQEYWHLLQERKLNGVARKKRKSTLLWTPLLLFSSSASEVASTVVWINSGSGCNHRCSTTGAEDIRK